MKQLSKAKIIKQYTHILTKYHFLDKTIPPFSIETFNDLTDAILSDILCFNADASFKIDKCAKIQLLLNVIDNHHEEVTLSRIVKKISITYMILRRMTQEELIN